MVNLQKDIIRGKLWRVRAPEGAIYGDDYADSVAGAVWICLNPRPEKTKKGGALVA